MRRHKWLNNILRSSSDGRFGPIKPEARILSGLDRQRKINFYNNFLNFGMILEHELNFKKKMRLF